MTVGVELFEQIKLPLPTFFSLKCLQVKYPLQPAKGRRNNLNLISTLSYHNPRRVEFRALDIILILNIRFCHKKNTLELFFEALIPQAPISSCSGVVYVYSKYYECGLFGYKANSIGSLAIERSTLPFLMQHSRETNIQREHEIYRVQTNS